MDGVSDVGCGAECPGMFDLAGSGVTVEDLFKALDVDGDGVFSQKDFNAIDENKNGYLDDSEIAKRLEGIGVDVSQTGTARDGGSNGGGSGGGSYDAPGPSGFFGGLTYDDLLALFDKDGDGLLSEEELEAADLNGDGVIDQSEIDEARAELETSGEEGATTRSDESGSVLPVDSIRQQLLGGGSANYLG